MAKVMENSTAKATATRTAKAKSISGLVFIIDDSDNNNGNLSTYAGNGDSRDTNGERWEGGGRGGGSR